MILFIISAALIVIFLILINPVLRSLSLSERIIAGFICSSALIIFTLEISSLFTALNKSLVILSIQVLITLFTFLAVRKNITFSRLGFFPAKANQYLAEIWNLLKRHWGVSIYLGLIIVIYAFLWFLSISFPQNTTDALYNHLSRIGYWLQQGSLRPYDGFNNVGTTYPYNNSLLMLWPIIFIRSEILVGSVQWIATLITAVIIYGLGMELGFPKTNSLLAALIYLTFPLILLQSITAQNDTLAACYISAAFLFMIKFINKNERSYLILSTLAYGLALGTKQYALFVLPGYLLLFGFKLIRPGNKLKIIASFASALILFSFSVGSYAYLQNLVTSGSLFGKSDVLPDESLNNQFSNLPQKIGINSARLFSQFISCEGLPPAPGQQCTNLKTQILKPIFINERFNIEEHVYLLEEETPFVLSAKPILNEESAWFGFLSWVLIIPAMFYGVVHSIQQRKFEGIILIFTALLHFVIVSFFKIGWDLYAGRYLITSVVLLMPFTAFIFSQEKFIYKTLVAILCVYSIFITAYTLINNNSRPLIGRTQFYRTSWEDFTPAQKIAYKFLPLIENDKSAWGESRIDLQTLGDLSYRVPLQMVENQAAEDAVLGIVAREGYLPDYLFFGKSFSRKIQAFKNGETPQNTEITHIEYVLVSPDYPDYRLSGFQTISDQKGWRLLENIQP